MHLACRVRTADADGRSDFQPNRRYTRNTITMEASIGGSWTLRPMVSSNPIRLERNPINPLNPDTLKFAPFELLYLSHGNRTCCLSLVFCAGAHTASRRRSVRSRRRRRRRRRRAVPEDLFKVRPVAQKSQCCCVRKFCSKNTEQCLPMQW